MQDKRRHDTNQPRGRRGGWEEGRWQGRGDEAGGRGGGRRRDERHGPGRGRDRARRGDARYILLDALRDGPKHGYEIIKSLEERSGGKYVPSPGTVYPTLQYLEDQGFVHASQEAERRIYQLTESGKTELDAQTPQVAAFWKRINGQDVAPATQQEVGFLEDELEHLHRIVWSGLRLAIAQGRQDTVRRVRAAVEECQDKVREIIAAEQTR